MEIIGQFNNAFIFACLNDQMFMVDQHASDEKFNFERFQKRARISTQKLILQIAFFNINIIFSPQTLELGAVQNGVLRDNVDIFRANGFDFSFNDSGKVKKKLLNLYFKMKIILKLI